jgi:hypothetical protein
MHIIPKTSLHCSGVISALNTDPHYCVGKGVLNDREAGKGMGLEQNTQKRNFRKYFTYVF